MFKMPGFVEKVLSMPLLNMLLARRRFLIIFSLTTLLLSEYLLITPPGIRHLASLTPPDNRHIRGSIQRNNRTNLLTCC